MIKQQSVVSGDSVIEDLGTLGGNSSFGNGINSFGVVTGVSFLPGDPIIAHAFRFLDGQGMVDVGTPEHAMSSAGMRINSGGLICGGYKDANGFDGSFKASVEPKLTILDQNESWAWDVNDRGQIIGESQQRFSPPLATLWTSPEEKQNLGTLGGTFSIGHAINEYGQAAGHSGTTNDITFIAFRYTPGVPHPMESLGTLGGNRSTAFGINDSGQVVGMSETFDVRNSKRFLLGSTSEPSTHAFLWTEGVGMVDLGALSGSSSIFGQGNSVAKAINNMSVVVGYSTLGPMQGGTNHAFRWTKEEGMIDLNTLLPSGSGWVLHEARDINDKGAITGSGLHNGERRAFRMFHHQPPVVKS